MSLDSPVAAPVLPVGRPDQRRPRLDPGARAADGERVRWCLLLAGLSALAAPATASAGSASVVTILLDGKYMYTEPGVLYAAAPGERNQVVVTREGLSNPTTYTVRDAGATVVAGDGCVALDAHAARCVASGALVDAGDGDDMVAMPQLAGLVRGHVRGGDGDDTLTGAGVLAGGPGRDTLASACAASCRGDVLAGGPDDDVLRGGPFDDELSGDGDGREWPPDGPAKTTDEAGGDDVIDGGGGSDTLTYDGRGEGVRVDLARRTAGTGREQDKLAGIEIVRGGDGADVLLGDDGPQQMLGGPGSDRLDGRGGDDQLFGYVVPFDRYRNTFDELPDGADVLHGGAGDDALDAGGERGDKLYGDAGDDVLDADGGAPVPRPASCGRGSDTVAFDPRGRLLADCERMTVGIEGHVSVRPERRSRALRFVATCRRYPSGLGCVLRLSLRLRGSRVGTRTVTIAAGERRAVLVSSRRRLRRGDVVEVTAAMAHGPTLRPGLASDARWRAKL